MPAGNRRHDRTADEPSKRWIGGAPCLEGGQLSCRHHFNDGRSESTHLPLSALHLGEPLIEARGAQVWRHRKHATQVVTKSASRRSSVSTVSFTSVELVWNRCLSCAFTLERHSSALPSEATRPTVRIVQASPVHHLRLLSV